MVNFMRGQNSEWYDHAGARKSEACLPTVQVDVAEFVHSGWLMMVNTITFSKKEITQ